MGSGASLVATSERIQLTAVEKTTIISELRQIYEQDNAAIRLPSAAETQLNLNSEHELANNLLE